MDIPLQITYHNIKKSEVLEKKIQERVKKLEKFFDHIISCRVVIDIPHKHKIKGNVYSIKIEIHVPNEEIVVTRSNEFDKIHKFPNVMIKDAFNAAKRQLEDYARIVRRDVKKHETPPHGIVNEIYKNKGYGNIETPDGRFVYFHKNSVVNYDFKKMDVGKVVRFVEEAGDKGPQASTVKVIDKHRISDLKQD
ncbi:MAG: HPF/RaiA family ribosome-associated protein [Thermodesulfobacteriota bacterium]